MVETVMDLKQFTILFMGCMVVTAFIVSLAIPWYSITSTTPYINKDGEQDDCVLSMQFGWWEVTPDCNPYECPCIAPYFPGVRTYEQVCCSKCLN
jgi:hypothetical protein